MDFLATLGSLWGTGKTPEELQAESADLDARLAALQEDKRRRDQAYLAWLEEEGFNTSEQQQRLDERAAIERAHLDAQRADTANIVPSINAAADAGLAEGRENVSGSLGFFRGLISDVLSAPFKLVPWWVWILAAVALFIYLGGGNLVRAQIRRASK